MFNGIPTDVVSDILASVAIAVLGAIGYWLRRQFKDLGRMTRDWNGEPARPGISDGTPSVMQRLYAQEQHDRDVMEHLGRQDDTLNLIKHEIEYNHGSSIKDAVHRTDDAIKALGEDVTAIKRKLDGAN